VIIAHKIALDPNDRQETCFRRACGTARFAYNWALAEWQKQYKAGGKPSEAALRKLLNSLKGEQFPWMLEVTKNLFVDSPAWGVAPRIQLFAELDGRPA